MTVQTNTSVAIFNGNGSTQIFPIGFKFNKDTDLVVLLADDETGASSPLFLNSDYTVSGEGDEEGGLINVLSPPAIGKRLFVSRIVDILQMTDLRNQGKFFAEVHEDAFDLLTMIAQQHQANIARSLRVAETDPEPARMPPVSIRAGKMLSFDSNGNPQAAVPVTDSAAELRIQLANNTSYLVDGEVVGGLILPIKSIAALRARAGRYDGDVVYLRGRTESSTLGAGIFQWKEASAAADDDGITVSKWIRQVTGPEIDAGWYGASVSSADNTAACQAAVNAAISTGLNVVRLPGKGLFASSALANAALVTFVSCGAFFSDYLYAVQQDHEKARIDLPAAFSWFPGKLYSGGSPGTAKTNVNVDALWYEQEVSGIIPYYISPAGNDANSGTQPNAPLKTLAAAIAKGSVGIIYAAPGVYYGGIGTAIGTTVARDIRIFSQSGGKDVVVRTGVDASTLTWTLNTGSTYEATPGLAVNQVFDGSITDDNGDYYQLTARGSIADVNANPGSWWYDSASSKVYIRMPTDRSPSSDAVLLGSAVGTVTGNRALYLRGIRFEGGGLRLVESGGVRPRLYMYNSDQLYGANFNIDSDGGVTYLEDVITAKAGLDNLNYHDQGAVSARAVEINVTSYGAGYFKSGDENKNASSMHDTGSVVRVNGRYFDSYGPNIPDTGSSTSFNIGVSAYRSTAPTATQDVNFYSDGGMYLVDCFSGKGSAYDIRVSAGTVSVRNLQDDGLYLREGGGAIQQF